MNILLLGGSGLVGSSVKENIKKKKLSYTAPSRRELNLFSYNKIKNYLNVNKITHVINCAAKVGGILDNQNNQIKYYEENNELNYNIIKACKNYKIQNFINLGSSCMYPKTYLSKMSENHLMSGPLEETNFTYALSKISAAYYLNSIRNEMNLNYTTLIPCNLFGIKDKFDLQRAHLIPAIIAKIYKAKINNEKKIMIWGSGKPKREFLFVDNVAEYIVTSIIHDIKFPPFLNIGANKDYSVKQYYEIVMKLMKIKLKIEYDSSKPDGMKRKLIDSSLAIKKYNWRVKYSLEDGIKKTIGFFLKNNV